MSPPSRPNDRYTEEEVPWVEEDHGAPFRFRVHSLSDPNQWHLVDLTARNGMGECGCQDYATRAAPNFRRHGLYIPYAKGREGRTECRHLRAAFEHLQVHVVMPMLAQFAEGIVKK